jgi:hypothetical protein
MIVIDTWKGLVTNASPYALPPGAAVVQTNFQCRKPGELSARGGQTAATLAVTAQFLEMFRCPVNGQERVVYLSASGNVGITGAIT